MVCSIHGCVVAGAGRRNVRDTYKKNQKCISVTRLRVFSVQFCSVHPASDALGHTLTPFRPVRRQLSAEPSPVPPVGGRASRMVRGLMLRGHTKMRKICWSPGLRPGPRWGSLQRFSSPRTPSCWGGAPRGAGLCCPPPQEPHLQYCHCACPVCMYARV